MGIEGRGLGEENAEQRAGGDLSNVVDAGVELESLVTGRDPHDQTFCDL